MSIVDFSIEGVLIYTGIQFTSPELKLAYIGTWHASPECESAFSDLDPAYIELKLDVKVSLFPEYIFRYSDS